MDDESELGEMDPLSVAVGATSRKGIPGNGAFELTPSIAPASLVFRRNRFILYNIYLYKLSIRSVDEMLLLRCKDTFNYGGPDIGLYLIIALYLFYIIISVVSRNLRELHTCPRKISWTGQAFNIQ